MSETTGTTVKSRIGSRRGSEYRPRLRGDEREEMRRTLAKKYGAGASIRTLASEHSLSYGLTRHLLVEAKVTLRGRSGQRKGRG
ncbi:transcriptional regulator [Streptomyces sp. AJS327]|uniref:helix-turn-helix domain-containing protein n=1 Tax=Streptomyces sp. AJS327 TaxID=2545265 RepID=UPI0015DFD18C|nr:helix-turn-helix domain-containing protein [Streptomyces sp. AJS327]MBA0053487.1 transcriptional regulator [Streptomyces sp. AJS327]